MTPASSRLLSLWDDVRPGTVVTLRRQTGERTRAWTAGCPFCTSSGVACIRVDLGGATVAYPLERVSLGWDEPRAGAPVPLATVLDPPPPPPPGALAVLGDALVVCAFGYVVTLGLATIAAAVLR